MLARWLDRGLGQILAPDETHASQPPEDEARSVVWQFLAPDPKFSANTDAAGSHRRVPPSSAFLSPPPGSREVQCVHCQQWTPSKPNYTDDSEDEIYKPDNVDQLAEDVDQLVLSAAKNTVAGITSPPHVSDARSRVFRLCSNPVPLTEKLVQRLRQLLINNPSLIESRATAMGISVPDGFTPLMAAAYVDQAEAAKIILQMSPNKAHIDRDLQGRTPLHIAAEMGHVKTAKILRQHEGVKSPPRTDLLGRTPLGRALTSSYASKNQPELQEVLFSPDDVSIRGVRTPAKTRASSHRELELVAGHAEMPGLRITMEDALLCFQSWASHEQREQWALFGVCDGHNDFGQASAYIVEHVVDVLRDSLDQHQLQDDKDWDSIWTRTCLKLDASYKETNLGGGTTGVFALVSAKSIIVANVGDSRCIMVQREIESQPTGQETQTESPPELKDEGTASALKGYVLSPLSQDHKPELEEEQIRVQKAGLTVTAETFKEQDGQEETIYKITRSANERISMSRSFGDYEYKSNESLGPEEQAVIAVPEIKAHARDGDRDLFLILACDGVWDVMSNEDAATFVLEQVEKELERKDDGSCLAQVADRLLEECLRLGSRDNMSVIIVALSAFAEKVSAGQVVRGKTLDFAGVST